MTDQPKWTPGPWVISTATQGYEACTVHGVERQPTEDGLGKTWVYIRPETLIRDGELHWPDEQEQLANARLIAAAPDLYAALEPLDAVATDRAVNAPEWRNKDTVGVSLTIGELRAIRAALAKARGQA